MERKSGLTRHTYEYTYKVLSEYKNIDTISFEEITPKWLEGFDAWCKSSNNTKGLHYRNIRAVFNDAIDEEITSHYPFRKFKIKKTEPKQRSLSIEELRRFWFWPVEPQQEKYHDIFKLTFLLRGINIKDLCLLTRENVKAGRIIYCRAKTGKPYSIKIEPEIQELLDKYKGKNYLIDILDRYKNYVDYNRRLNKELGKIGVVEYGKRGKKSITPLIEGITTYYARHSFATIGHYDCGISMDVISDLLGHSNGLQVTNIYIRKNERIADEAARRIIDKVLYDK
jgi:integrase